MWNPTRTISLRTLAASAVLTLIPVAAASAGDDQAKIQLTPAGQAAARAAVLTRADLGSGSGWTGGPVKPSTGSQKLCANFQPKQSDIVHTGEARSVFKAKGLEFQSEATVVRTAAMARLDWQRNFRAPNMLGCMRSIFAKVAAKSKAPDGTPGRLVSFEELKFPHITPQTAAFRVIIDFPTDKGTLQVLSDLVFVARGRTEISLTTSTPAALGPTVFPAEVRLARVLARRARV
jgi:hypothetical protein